MPRKDKIFATGFVHLDPLDCGSVVSYTVTEKYGRVAGEIGLTDCNRKIEWYFGRRSDPAKIDRAIEILQRFKLELAKARMTKRTRKKVRNA